MSGYFSLMVPSAFSYALFVRYKADQGEDPVLLDCSLLKSGSLGIDDWLRLPVGACKESVSV